MFDNKRLVFILTPTLLLIGGIGHVYNFSATEERSLASASNSVRQKKHRSMVSKTKVKKQSLKRKKIKAPNSDSKSPLSTVANELNAVKQCYNVETCDYPHTDPKSYHFGVSMDLKEKLYSLQQSVLKNKIKSPEVADIAREYLAIEEGHVKEAALHLLSTQETSSESLESLIDDILKFHDAKLIPHAMLELQRYLGSNYESKIHKALLQAIQKGAPSVSQAIVDNLRPFINRTSMASYQEGLNGLSPKTRTYKQLKTVVEDFKKSLTAA